MKNENNIKRETMMMRWLFFLAVNFNCQEKCAKLLPNVLIANTIMFVFVSATIYINYNNL